MAMTPVPTGSERSPVTPPAPLASASPAPPDRSEEEAAAGLAFLGRTALRVLIGTQSFIRRTEDRLRGYRTTLQSNFAFAIATLPAERREGVVALYRYARIADDIADDDGLSLEEREIGIHQLRRDLDRIFAGQQPGHSGLIPLAATVARFGVTRPPLDALLDGVAADLRVNRYERFEGLYQYCQRVASAVGLACLPVFGCRDRASDEYADELGLALQLTNIVRDVGEDAQRGRIYLPLEDLERFGVDPGSILRGESSRGFDDLIRFEAERARAYDRRAQLIWRSLPAGDRVALSAAEIMRTTYAALLDQIEASGFDVLRPPGGAPGGHRALPLWRRAAIAGATLLRTGALGRTP